MIRLCQWQYAAAGIRGFYFVLIILMAYSSSEGVNFVQFFDTFLHVDLICICRAIINFDVCDFTRYLLHKNNTLACGYMLLPHSRLSADLFAAMLFAFLCTFASLR